MQYTPREWPRPSYVFLYVALCERRLDTPDINRINRKRYEVSGGSTISAPVGRRACPAGGPAAGWSPSWCWPDAPAAPYAGTCTTFSHKHCPGLKHANKQTLSQSSWERNIWSRLTRHRYLSLPRHRFKILLFVLPLVVIAQTVDFKRHLWVKWTLYFSVTAGFSIKN